MRHLKMMGLAALAVFALVALAGATTASATRLCTTTNTSPCTHFYAHTNFNSDLQAGTTSVWTTSGSPVGVNPTFTCATSGLGWTSTNAGGGAGVPVGIRLTSLVYTSCTSVNPAGCSTTWTVGSLANATGQVAWTSGVNGTLTYTPPTVSYTCAILGMPVNCTIGGSGTVDGMLTGGHDPVIDIVNQNMATTGGFGCPTSMQWNARYTVTNHTIIVTNS
jgi:hypothetical protein